MVRLIQTISRRRQTNGMVQHTVFGSWNLNFDLTPVTSESREDNINTRFKIQSVVGMNDLHANIYYILM